MLSGAFGPDEEDRGRCVVSNGKSYNLYSPTGNLSVGVDLTARMVAVDINKVRSFELQDIYLNYSDAALLELYRENNVLLDNGKDDTPKETLSGEDVKGYLLCRGETETVDITSGISGLHV